MCVCTTLYIHCALFALKPLAAIIIQPDYSLVSGWMGWLG